MSYGPYNYEGFGAVTNTATDCKLLCDLAAGPGGSGCQAYSYIPSNTNNNCVLIPNMAATNVIPAVLPGATSSIISANKPASITSGNSYNNFITGAFDSSGLLQPPYSETSAFNCSTACNAIPSCMSFTHDGTANMCSLHTFIGNQTTPQNANAKTYFQSGVLRDNSQYNSLTNIVYVPITTGRFVRIVQPQATSNLFVGHIQVYGSAANLTSNTGYITPAATVYKFAANSPLASAFTDIWYNGSFAWYSAGGAMCSRDGCPEISVIANPALNSYGGTRAVANQWIQIDLGGMFPIYAIYLKNRSDSAKYTWNGAYVVVYDDTNTANTPAPGAIQYQSSLLQDPTGSTTSYAYTNPPVAHAAFSSYMLFPPNPNAVGSGPITAI